MSSGHAWITQNIPELIEIRRVYNNYRKYVEKCAYCGFPLPDEAHEGMVRKNDLQGVKGERLAPLWMMVHLTKFNCPLVHRGRCHERMTAELTYTWAIRILKVPVGIIEVWFESLSKLGLEVAKPKNYGKVDPI